VIDEGPLAGADEQTGELIRITRPDVRVDAHFSFLQVTERSDYRDYTGSVFPTRLPGSYLRRLLAVQDEVFNEQVAKAREAAAKDKSNAGSADVNEP
jgi:hypothetical protein